LTNTVMSVFQTKMPLPFRITLNVKNRFESFQNEGPRHGLYHPPLKKGQHAACWIFHQKKKAMVQALTLRSKKGHHVDKKLSEKKRPRHT